MTKDEALKLALDALETSTDWDVNATGKQLKSMQAITALRTALAQPEERDAAIKTLEHLKYTYHGGEYWKPPLGKVRALAQPVQPERPWVGLTDEEISNFVNVVWPCEVTSADYVCAIEQALKEKNNG